MSKHKDEFQEVSLFGKDFEKTKKLQSTGIEQGSLGDNYLLTVLAALAERDLVPDMFSQKKYNHEGIFTIKVYVKGRPENVTVDDLYPIYNN